MITALDKNTALVLIDLQNSNVNTPKAHLVDEMLDNVNKIILAFRQKQLPIIVINVNPKNAAWLKSRKDTKQASFPDDDDAYKITGKLNLNAQDISITKYTWNAFFETSLHNELKNKSVTGIVLAGISTSIGVEGTARAASELGYNISFALDAMTDTQKAAPERSIEFIFPRMGETGSTDEIIFMLNNNFSESSKLNYK